MRNLNTRLRYISSAAAVAAALTVLPALAHAQDAPEPFVHADGTPFTTDEKIQFLIEELDTLKRQRDLDVELAQKAAATAPTVVIDNKGFKATSVDKGFEFSLSGGMQIDARQYLDDTAGLGRDDILARRIRPTFQLKAGDATFRLTPDFALTNVTYMDAWVDYRFSDAVNIRVGKSKTAVGYERNVSFPDMVFAERGHATNLAPSRDFGIQVFGAVPGLLDYQVGIFNGSADLANNFNDGDENKDIHARIGFTPFANTELVVLQGLTVGVAASTGERDGTTASTLLGTYKSPGQADFFRYSTNVYADGEQKRLNPYASWYLDNYGLLTEYITSTQNVTVGTNHAKLEHKALTVMGNWVLTGESLGYKGGIKPSHPFNPGAGGWGAWELAVRYGYTDIDDATFPLFASTTASASKAESWGAGVSWYLSQNLKLLLNYEATQFDGGATAGANRPDETFVVNRLQVRF